MEDTIKRNVDTENCNVILAGDMNTGLSELDNISGVSFDKRVVGSIQNVLDSCALVDSWRMVNPKTKEFTWQRCNPFTARRLDYVFVSKKFVDKCCSAKHVDVANTDHRMVCIDIDCSEAPRGPGYWKLNNNLLKDDKFVILINETLEQTVAVYRAKCNPKLLWDVCKSQIRDVAIEYSKQKRRAYKCDLELMETR